MAVNLTDIVVGGCYENPAGQVRKVTEIKNGRVAWVGRGKKPTKKWDTHPTKANPPTLETFAKAVVRRITCPPDAP